MMFEMAPSRLALPYAYSNLVVAAFCTAAGRVKLLEELVVCDVQHRQPLNTATHVIPDAFCLLWTPWRDHHVYTAILIR
jgi:hypothetical protein